MTVPKIPTVHQSPITLYIGIDPGQNGGLVAISSDKKIWYEPMPSTERDVIEWFRNLPLSRVDTVMIERQIPRPTRFLVNGRWQSSILKSTCLLYGDYMLLNGIVSTLGLSLQEILPQAWQKALGLVRKKGMTDGQWKDQLRGKAQQFHPRLDIWSIPRTKGKQLAIADALLIATYCKRKQEGTL